MVWKKAEDDQQAAWAFTKKVRRNYNLATKASESKKDKDMKWLRVHSLGVLAKALANNQSSLHNTTSQLKFEKAKLQRLKDAVASAATKLKAMNLKKKDSKTKAASKLWKANSLLVRTRLQI